MAGTSLRGFFRDCFRQHRSLPFLRSGDICR
jgi:hypothetical protein